jgi:hypothetical protein
MRKILVENNIVSNMVEVDEVSGWLPSDGATLHDPIEGVGIGWLFDGSNFIAPAPAVVPVPQSITPLQARKALRALGLHAQVVAYVATLSDEAQEDWEYCITVERLNGLVVTAATALGMSEPQIDDLFRLGKTYN